MKYHIWTEGCQMNVADSQRVGSSLEHLGYTLTDLPEEADVIVLNTCVVRQSAEDKAIGRVSSFKKLKEQNPNLVINLMGCLVGVRGVEKLKARLPYVDVFSPPSDPSPLISHLTQGEIRSLEDADTTRRFLMMDEELKLPVAEQGKTVSVHVPIVYGCSHACTFCIIPYKRGIERSRPVGDIVAEIRSLAKQGVKEITLLGQPFVKDGDVTVENLLKKHAAKVVAFTRFEVGEGIEKKEENFAAEVMAQVQASK